MGNVHQQAHSGPGSHMDDARVVNLKRLGPTPPNTYKLLMREKPSSLESTYNFGRDSSLLDEPANRTVSGQFRKDAASHSEQRDNSTAVAA
jgi:Protein of unknown function (DUF2778)